MFDEQHAPVLVTDSAGIVTGVNAAATSLLESGVPGRLLSGLVATSVIVLIDVTAEERHCGQGAYAAHLLTVQEDERRRLAQDLHDDPVQTLTYHVRMPEQLSDDPGLAPDLAERSAAVVSWPRELSTSCAR